MARVPAQARGFTVVLVEQNFRFAARLADRHYVVEHGRIVDLIEKERVSTWSAIPTMLHRVVYSPALGNYDLSSLVRISFGGAPTGGFRSTTGVPIDLP